MSPVLSSPVLSRRALLAATALAACGDDESPAPASCTTEQVGPDPDFASARAPDSERIALATKVADHFIGGHPPTEAKWDWADAVLMFSLVELYRVTGHGRFRDHYRAWLDHHLAGDWRGLVTTSDRCPPALSALSLYQQTCEPRYREVVERVITYLESEALRTEDGGINHLGVEDLFGVSLWLDSLFMFGNVYVRWGEHTGEARWLDAFAEQYRIFAEHLQDEVGWMMHAHAWPAAEQDAGVYWARGNAWVTAAGYEYLRVRKQRGESDPEVEASLNKQVGAIIDAQDLATGLWWTVVNRPGETYLETSGSALFAAGLARGHRLGLLGDDARTVAEAAVAGVDSRIEDDGTVTGTSGPTTVGDFEHYAGIEVAPDIPYGAGAVILMLVETSGL